MSDQEENLGGFCFNCAVKDPSDMSTHPEVPYNPFPILIKSKALNLTRSQPLICTMYTPTPLSTIEKIKQRRQRRTGRGKPSSEAINDFYDWFIQLHEYAHLSYLYWTPAKEAAKIFLSVSYHSLDLLLGTSATERIEKYWEQFTKGTEILDKIEKKIGFVEELIATALSIDAMERQTLPGAMWTGFQEELALLKGIALANEEKNFPGFRVAYKRIEPLVKLMAGNRYLVPSILPLLQPIYKVENEEDEVLAAYDARSHLDIISEMIFLGGTINEDLVNQRVKWLIEQEEAITEELEAWKTALSLQMELAHQAASGNRPHIGNFTQIFWKLARGDFEQPGDNLVVNPSERADQIVKKLQDLFASGMPSSPGGIMVLQRDVHGSRSFIGMHYRTWSGMSAPDSVIEDHIFLLIYEGIRQQVLARKGFVCPVYKGGQRCRCNHEMRKVFQRLSHLASDGLFGPGEWSLPPCLSSCL